MYMSLIINTEKYIVIYNGKRIELPLREFELMLLLCKYPGKVYSRKQLFDELWGKNSTSKERTVDVHIARIREKTDKELIKNIIGVGYKITTYAVVIEN